MLRKWNNGLTPAVGFLAGLFLVLFCLGVAGAGEVPWDKHSGEQIFNRSLYGVINEDGRLMLNWHRKNFDVLAPDATMSYCGEELEPTEDNLRGMIGKPVYGWGFVQHRQMVIHRLEFQCR